MTKLQIRAFFFNAQTDYLPYYKNFTFKVENDVTILEILTMIKTENPDFSFPEANTILRVNDLVLTADETVGAVVEQLGTDLQIDPALTYRSNNGLILNDDDFMESFNLLSAYTDEEDLAFYQNLYTVHYASESLNYNHEYIGDAVLILAARLLEKENTSDETKEAILATINDKFNGISFCEYDNNLFHAQNHAQTIQSLKEQIGIKERTSIVEKLSSLIFGKKDHEIEGELEEHAVALYLGDRNSNELNQEIKTTILESGAKFVNFSRSVKLAGQSIMNSKSQLAHQKAGLMLLDALDSGASILLFSKDEDVEVFKSALPKAEREVGRPIKLKLLSVNDFKALTTENTES